MGKKKKGKQPKKKGGGYADLLAEDDGGGRGQKGGKGQSAPPSGRQRKQKTKGGKAGTQMFDDDRFRKTLLADGKKSINEMSSDGNCLFRSLSDQLYGDYGNRHDQIRKEVCDFLQENEDYFAVFLLLDEDEEDVCDFDEYIGKMREDGEWGGNVELVSAARLYERTVTVFSPTGAFSIESGHEEVSGDNLLLSYHDNGHYNSLRDENTRIQQPQTRSRSQMKKSAKAVEEEEEEKKADAAQIDNRDAAGTAEEDTAKDNAKSNKASARRATCIENEKPLPKRNDPCPCGSGLRYKKCCLAVEKSKARAAKWKEKHGDDGAETSSAVESEELLEGEFRVLKI